MTEMHPSMVKKQEEFIKTCMDKGLFEVKTPPWEKTPMQSGLYTAISTETAAALRAQLERLGVETAGMDSDGLVAAAIQWIKDELDREDAATLDLSSGVDVFGEKRRAVLEAAQHACQRIKTYRETVAFEARQTARGLKNEAYMIWKELEEVQSGQEGSAQ